MNIPLRMSIRTKLLVYVLATSIGVLGAIGIYIQFRTYKMAINDAHKIAISYSEKAANQIQSELELDLGFSRAWAHSLQGYYRYDSITRDSIYFDIAKRLVQENPRYVSVWYNLEYFATRPNYSKNYGRRSVIAVMEHGFSKIIVEPKNMSGDIVTSGYYKAKNLNQEVILDPYFDSFDMVNEILVTSICIPIRKDDNFIGLAGVDLTLDKFQKTIAQINPYPNTQAFLLSNNSTIVNHSNLLNTGKAFQVVYPEIEMQHSIVHKVERGSSYSFDWHENGDHFLYIIAPIKVGNSSTHWAVGISIPYSAITLEARNSLLSGIFVAFIGIIVLSLVIFYVAKSITNPIRQTTKVLTNMAKGDIDQGKKLSITSADEIGEMASSVNKLIEGLNLTEKFASEIGKGNLDAEYNLLGDKDQLGISLIEMQKSLKKAKEVEIERKAEEEKQNWATKGIATFGDILRQNNDNLNELSFNTIKNLVDYTNSNQGGVFVINDNDTEHPLLEMTACYAFDRRKYLEKTIEIGEGLVGRCFKEGKTIFMTDVPETYIKISSGLGKNRPRCLMLVPLKNNDEVLGVIEIASFRVYEKFEVEFIEKLAESIAATLSSTKINIRTTELLAKSQQQAEEMLAQEEEMRQNMEELQATQEEMERKRAEQEQIQDELQREITLLNALMENIPDYIYFKNENSHFIQISKSMVKLFNADSPEELVGKSDFDFHAKENAEKFFIEEQEIMRNKTPIVDKVVHEKFEDGREQWVSTTKMPLIDTKGEVVGTWGISKIITDLKMAELKAQKLADEAEKLKSQTTSHEGEYQAIVKAIDSTTFLVEYSTDGIILRINDPLKAVLGKLAAEITGKHHEEFFRTKSDDDASYQQFWDDLRKGIIRQRVFKGTIGGARLTLNETYSPVLDKKGNIEKIIAIAVRG
ncbi:MAG: PAS domain-containing protein [Bacteroidales bacterium]|jgi:PAS domain S-box-containing protein|nr:PAS domain-containing protein [Bacteroidales bacterium]MDD4385653.1 PAS domain-containing protein [Bacteroidales bacterium]MDY0197816.1 PAS domain-containing protein [Tenuifilaceae bacterium]